MKNLKTKITIITIDLYRNTAISCFIFTGAILINKINIYSSSSPTSCVKFYSIYSHSMSFSSFKGEPGREAGKNRREGVTSQPNLELDFSSGLPNFTGIKLAPQWVTGIIDSEGNFSILVQNTSKGYKISLPFKVTQNQDSLVLCVLVFVAVYEFLCDLIHMVYVLDLLIVCILLFYYSIHLIYFMRSTYNYLIKWSKIIVWHTIVKYLSYLTYVIKKNNSIVFSKYNNYNSCVAISSIAKLINKINIKCINKDISKIRLFTSGVVKQYENSSLNNIPQETINPWFVTGFTDGEGSFHIQVTKGKEYKLRYTIRLYYSVNLHKKDIGLLKELKNYFGVGKIYTKKNKFFFVVMFQVNSQKDLVEIIKHFDKYPLITQKRADYELFKQAFKLMERGEHLTQAGLHKIVAIKASMNLGLSHKLKAAFPAVVPVERPLVNNPKRKIPTGYPNWLVGFVSGEGCFFVQIISSSTHRQGFKVILRFQLTQHQRDEELLKSLVTFFGCGNYYRNYSGTVSDFRCQKISDIQDKIIPFFTKYPIHGVKALDFADWRKVAELINEKKHLTKEGLNKIKQIKARMNRGRII